MVNTILITTVVVLVVIVLMLAVAFKQLLKEYLELYNRVLDLQVDEFINLQVPTFTKEYDPFAEDKDYDPSEWGVFPVETLEDLEDSLLLQMFFVQQNVRQYFIHTLTTRLSNKPCDCMDCQHDLDRHEREEAMAIHDERVMREFYDAPSDWEEYQKDLVEEFRAEFPKTEGTHTHEAYNPFADEFVSPPHTGKTNCPCWECEEARIEGPICTEHENCGCNDCSDQRKLEKFYAESGCTGNIHNCECLECKDQRMFAGLDMVE